MEHISFYKSFQFNIHRRTCYNYTDNTCGIPYHYVARMVSGHARIVVVSGEEMELCEGDVFYLPKGLRYQSYWTCEDGGEIVWESYGFKMLPTSREMRYSMQKIDATSEDSAILDELSKNIKVSPSSVGLLYLFLGKSLEKMRQDRTDPKAATWEMAVSYISAHPNFQVKELATYCNMSESGIYAFFKHYGNTTPIELKNKMLIGRAIELLTTTDLSIEEICSRVGFCNTAYFRKQLRRVTGKTPIEIRKNGERI
ncbi:MAG: helix-turn-helix domain-containing protein [Clostridia bacterium]|nr:helix-turn-helix domain-containing protein [Clostridia bacterium]